MNPLSFCTYYSESLSIKFKINNEMKIIEKNYMQIELKDY